jgi:hypothetical protein
MIEEQLTAVRLYTAEEVVAMLRLRPTWLKNWITQKRVPHLRAGADRGVRFTQAHILEIGSQLPELLGGHRGGRAADDAREPSGPVQQAESLARPEDLGRRAVSGPARPAPPVVDIAAWAQLKAHHPRSRGV